MDNINFKHNKFTTNFAERTLTIEINKTSQLANGSCWVRYGNTVVMANVTMSEKPRDGIDFFPLSVEYEEKFYAAGKIPGSFIKREGKPSNYAILVSRCIDRAIRPFFPKDMRNDVSVVATVLATDVDNSPEVCAMLASSVALFISNIPWNGPIVSVNVGLVDEKIVLNPKKAEREKSSLNLTVAASSEKIVMIEAQANEISESLMLKSIEEAHIEIKHLISFLEANLKPYQKEKYEYLKFVLPDELLNKLETENYENIKLAMLTKSKSEREQKLNSIVEKLQEKFIEIHKEKPNLISECVAKIEKKILRNLIINENIRIDGRQLDEIRPISCEVDVLPQVHGSAIFSRGLTQTMSIVTLGGPLEEQKLDGLNEQTSKRYIHHYNFPSYSVGETKISRGPGRREIGHGALAERALKAVIPTKEQFPYTIRVVTETLSSNGSTSQSSICSSTLALMDAGVPIKRPVAGISCGLISENDVYKTIVDIQGVEDFFGDMDFKVGGTKLGITAIQVDIKIDGLSLEIIKEVFEKTKNARFKIIDEVFGKVKNKPNDEVKDCAPKVISIKIPVDKIKNVIGAYGKTIQKITSEFNVKIDIQEDGLTYILGLDKNSVNKAKNFIETIVAPPKVGAVYCGKVTRIADFGAFVEIAPGKEGLIHISKISIKKVKNVSDVLKVGDEVMAKVIEIDSNGKISLSRKDALTNLN